MVSRRVLLAGGAAAAGLGIWALAPGPNYEAAVGALWRHMAPEARGETAYLVHYATLAANSHNAQPWRFQPTPDGVAILPDLARALPVADADNHHLFASLGCAATNMMLAAQAAGRPAEMRFVAGDTGHVEVALGRGDAVSDPLFDTILERQCTRSSYDGRAVPAEQLRLLEAAVRDEGCELVLIDDKPRVERVLELIVKANTAQVADPAFAAELKHWLRFNAGAAIASGDGLYSACSGNPTMPSWAGRLMFGFVFKPGSENDRYSAQVRSSAGLAVIVSGRDDPEGWVRAGRAYQRFALETTALGIRHAHLNQPVEVAATRPELAALLGIDGRPDLVLRFGYAPPMPRSLRRPVAEVLQT